MSLDDVAALTIDGQSVSLLEVLRWLAEAMRSLSGGKAQNSIFPIQRILKQAAWR